MAVTSSHRRNRPPTAIKRNASTAKLRVDQSSDGGVTPSKKPRLSSGSAGLGRSSSKNGHGKDDNKNENKDDNKDDNIDDDDKLGAFAEFPSEADQSDDGGVSVPLAPGGVKGTDKRRPLPAQGQDATTHNGLPSQQHAMQRQLAKDRRASKPLADDLHRTKKIWERLRMRSKVPREERNRLVEELLGIVSGRVHDFALKHDAARAIQTAIKYSAPEPRRVIARELAGSYAELAQSRYAKFLIGKLMELRDPEITALIVPEFYGRVCRLINHPEASWILDDIYRAAATAEHKAFLLREWYGPEFAIMNAASATAARKEKLALAQTAHLTTGAPAVTADPTPAVPAVTADLAELLLAEPSKRGPIFRYLIDTINSLVQKRMTGFTILHDAMLQCYSNLVPGSEQAAEFLEMALGDEEGDLFKNMAFTPSGSRLVCLLLARASAKDRRRMVRVFKGVISLMSADPHAHMVLVAAYDLVDDTKMTAKAILPELLGDRPEELAANVIAAANNPHARVALLFPLHCGGPSLFSASHAADEAFLAELRAIRASTSKKDPDVRRRELVAVLAPSLLAAVQAAAPDLARTTFGCRLMADLLLCDAVPSDDVRRAALDAVAALAAAEPSAPDHVAHTAHAGRLLKALIAGGRYDRAAHCVRSLDPPLGFADLLYPRVRDHVLSWATGPSSFVVLALLEAGDFAAADDLRARLRPHRKELQAVAAQNAGARMLLEKL